MKSACLLHAKDLFEGRYEGGMGAAEPCSGQGDLQVLMSTKCSMGQGATVHSSIPFLIGMGHAAQ